MKKENLERAYKNLSWVWMEIGDSISFENNTKEKRELYCLMKEIQKLSDKLLEYIKKDNEKGD